MDRQLHNLQLKVFVFFVQDIFFLTPLIHNSIKVQLCTGGFYLQIKTVVMV